MMEGCTVRVSGLSHQGLVRDQNEDRLIIDQSIGCFLVADGIGGHQAGEVASRITAEVVAKKISRMSGKNLSDPAKSLREAIAAAHHAVRKQADKSIAHRGMGSTIVVVWLQPSSCQLWLGHVGNSRAYLLRGQELIRLTEDHTIYNQAKRAGLLGPDPSTHPPQGALSQAIGPSDVIAPDTTRIELKAGDRLLLCSDGLTDMLSDEEIAALLITYEELETVCRNLIQAALGHGGKDNVTAIVLQIVKENG